ncbi:hypothetical protein [Embleya sp. NPDC005575]|uniref:hypothetical protein n=1 Tax=Embleya sp. NPDC005575 TaxID=3156892 RepID=UPI0033ADA1BD
MADQDDDHPNVYNQVSGGNFYGPVSQFRDVNGNMIFNWAQAPRSPEEMAFREQYMTEMRRQWAAQRAQRAGDRAAKGCGCIGPLVIILGIIIFYKTSHDVISTIFFSLLAIPCITGLLKVFNK